MLARGLPDPGGFLRGAVSMPAHHLWQRDGLVGGFGTSRGASDDDVEMIVYELEGIRHAKMTTFFLSNIEMVKRQLMRLLKLPRETKVNDLRLFFKGSEVSNHRTVASLGNLDDMGPLKLYWSCRDTDETGGVRPLGLKPPTSLRQLIQGVNLALGRGIKPKLAMDGTGGTYTLYDCQRNVVAVFKPKDEEAFAPNNPRFFVGRLGNPGFRKGVLSGEGATREVAAYLMDSLDRNFCGVPSTCKVEVKHDALCYKVDFDIHKHPFLYHAGRPKSSNGSSLDSTAANSGSPQSPMSQNYFWKDGSLQEFVAGAETVGDYSPDSFGTSDVQRIAIFDIRMMNLDRNDGNILVVRRSGPRAWRPFYLRDEAKTDAPLTPSGIPTKFRLVPIDHGLILPDTMEISDLDIVWYNWPQCHKPTGLEELIHILRIDPDADSQKISRYFEIRPACLRTMRVTCRLLKICAVMHLSLHQTARIMCREDDEAISPLEHLVKEALWRVHRALDSTSIMSLGFSTAGLDLSLPKENLRTLRPVQTTKSETSDDLADFFLSSEVSSDDDDSQLLSSDEEWDELLGQDLVGTASIDKEKAKFEASRLRDALRDREVQCSKITGIPLVEVGGDFCVRSLMLMNPARQWRQAERRKRRLGRMPSMEVPTNSIVVTSPIICHDQPRRQPTSTAATAGGAPANGRAPTSGTVRKNVVSSTLRRGTFTRLDNSVTSIWNLEDESGRRVVVDWSNPLFESLFFPIIEQMMRFYVNKCHPNWQGYPWNGVDLPPEYQVRAQNWSK